MTFSFFIRGQWVSLDSAMEAGLTDQVWSIEELVELLDNTD
jgi:hypothetical protein